MSEDFLVKRYPVPGTKIRMQCKKQMESLLIGQITSFIVDLAIKSAHTPLFPEEDLGGSGGRRFEYFLSGDFFGHV